MCCILTIMTFLGPRVAVLVWWLVSWSYWQSAYETAFWPIIGIIFAPWTTLFYMFAYLSGDRIVDVNPPAKVHVHQPRGAFAGDFRLVARAGRGNAGLDNAQEVVIRAYVQLPLEPCHRPCIAIGRITKTLFAYLAEILFRQLCGARRTQLHAR